MKPVNNSATYAELKITKETIPFLQELLLHLTDRQTIIIDINGNWAKLRAIHESKENGYVAHVDVFRKGYGTYGIRSWPDKYCYLETLAEDGKSLAPTEYKWPYTEITEKKIKIQITNSKVYQILVDAGYIVNNIDGSFLFETNAEIEEDKEFVCGEYTLKMSHSGIVFQVAK